MAMIQVQQAHQLSMALREPLYRDWFNFADLAARVGFKDDTRRSGDTEG